MDVRSLGIIGYGQFGRFIDALAREHLQEIEVRVAPRGDHAALKMACASDLVVLCVPIAAYLDVARGIAPLLGPASVVVDVATVKSHTVRALREAGITRLIATHPMFGPYSYEKQGRSLKGLRIALTETTLSRDERDALVKCLESAGLRVLSMTSDEHDRLIAETLFVTHLVGQVIHRGGFERTQIDTVSFGYLMDAVESVAHDEVLFRDVFQYDPYCAEVLERFTKSQGDIIATLGAPRK